MNTKKISIQKVLRLLVITAVALTVLHLIFQYLYQFTGLRLFEVQKIFDLDNEVSVPTWYSQILWLIAAFSAFMITGKGKGLWKSVAILCILLSIDEGSTVHEHVIIGLSELIPRHESGLSLAWIVFAVVTISAAALYFLRYVKDIPSQTRNAIIVAGGVFISGSVIVEIFGIHFLRGIEAQNTYLHLGVFVAIEEFLEMLGVILLVRVLLKYQLLNQPVYSIQLAE